MKKFICIILILILLDIPCQSIISTPTLITKWNPTINCSTSSASNLDTTGYDLIVILVTSYATQYVAGITDNKGNTYTAGPNTTSGAGSDVQLWYKYAPTVGTNTQFSVSCTSSYPGVIVIGVTGALTSSTPFDQSDIGSTIAGTSVQTAGTVTPTFDNEIIFSGLSSGASSDVDMTISGNGFIKIAGLDFVGSTNIAAAIAYVIQTSKTGVRPTWSSSTSTVGLATVVGSFQSVPSGGACLPPFCGIIGQ